MKKTWIILLLVPVLFTLIGAGALKEEGPHGPVIKRLMIIPGRIMSDTIPKHIDRPLKLGETFTLYIEYQVKEDKDGFVNFYLSGIIKNPEGKIVTGGNLVSYSGEIPLPYDNKNLWVSIPLHVPIGMKDGGVYTVEITLEDFKAKEIKEAFRKFEIDVTRDI